jgi:CrcB protein
MIFTGPVLIREEYRIAILVGILGGYTTFSAFGRETYLLAADGQVWPAIGNIVFSNVLGLVAVWLGHRVGEKLFGV